jgi:hypothetical protein
MGINDDNTLSDIEGHILCLQWDVEKPAPEFPVGPRFKELLARIDDKLHRNSNKIRRNWFQTARDHAVEAEKAFLEKRTRDSYESLRMCWDYLEQGNKAHRRKATFVALADGQVATVGRKEGEQSGCT